MHLSTGVCTESHVWRSEDNCRSQFSPSTPPVSGKSSYQAWQCFYGLHLFLALTWDLVINVHSPHPTAAELESVSNEVLGFWAHWCLRVVTRGPPLRIAVSWMGWSCPGYVWVSSTLCCSQEPSTTLWLTMVIWSKEALSASLGWQWAQGSTRWD